ncbi:hypothetical protein CAC42_2700 [Sphaceloma murrayae]|uniref:Chitin-binding type-4 domain-containing protein n=1 Tax=Sphaceloma murrayae TaxID=2082308 RepID=A0A2K1R0E1_9PEZI|nr:hypothetical protein CAC42_2700 [Sphaceloma murrayae]
MKSYTTVLAAASFVSSVAGHGRFMNPAPRAAGTAFQNACGMQAYYQVSSDPNGNVQGLLNVIRNQPDYKPAACIANLCKGLLYEDNTDKVQRYSAGQVVAMTFDVAAPHTGSANVSVVRTSDNTVIGTPLKSWDNFAPNAGGASPDQEDFTITIPDVGTQCSQPGACVLQHFWDADKPDISQTYESCIDVVIGGGSGEAAPAPAPSSSAEPAPVTVSSSSSQPPVVDPVTTTVAPATTAAPSTTVAPVTTTPAPVSSSTTTRRPIRRPTNTCACPAPAAFKRQASCNPTATVTVTTAGISSSLPAGYASTMTITSTVTAPGASVPVGSDGSPVPTVITSNGQVITVITRTATVTATVTATITDTVTVTPPAETTITSTVTQTSTVTSAVTVTAPTSKINIPPATTGVPAPFPLPNGTLPVQPGTTVIEASTSLPISTSSSSISFTFSPLPTGAYPTGAPFPTGGSSNSSTVNAVPIGTGSTSRPAATLPSYPSVSVPVGGDSASSTGTTSSTSTLPSVPIGTGVTSRPAATLPGSSAAPYPTITSNTNPDGSSTANAPIGTGVVPIGTGVISSIASLTSLIPTSAMNSTIPTNSGVYSSLSSLISALPTASNLPGYPPAPPRPTPGSGSKIADLLRWIADLILRAKAGAGAGGAAPTASPTPSAPLPTRPGTPYVFRRAARDFRPFRA